MPNKNADMSMQLIVAAVIALIVLVVALTIFGKGTGESAKTLQSCEGRGGECMKITDSCKGTTIPNVECRTDKPKCCLKV